MPQIRPMSSSEHEQQFDIPNWSSGEVTSRQNIEENLKSRTIGIELSKIYENSQDLTSIKHVKSRQSPSETMIVSSDYRATGNSRSRANSRSNYKQKLKILEPQSNNQNNLTAILEQRHEDSQQQTMTNFSCFMGSSIGHCMGSKGFTVINND